MTHDHSAMRELAERLQDADATLATSIAETMLLELIEAELTARIGAEPGERTPWRTAQRSGHRPKRLSTPAGDVEVGIPKLRTGSFFPELLEPRRRIDKALWAVIMRAYITGTSTRKVDDLVKDVAVLRGRRLDHLPFVYVWLDATYVHVLEHGQVAVRHVAKGWARRWADAVPEFATFAGPLDGFRQTCLHWQRISPDAPPQWLKSGVRCARRPTSAQEGRATMGEPVSMSLKTRRNAVPDLLRRNAARFPTRPAIKYGNQELTYGELHAKALEIAGGLAEAGIGPGDRVAFFGKNSDLYVLGWLAVQLAGAIHVPINFMLKADEVRYILDHAEPKLAFGDSDLLPILDEALAGQDIRLGLLKERSTPESSRAGLALEDLRADRPLDGPPDDQATAQIAYTSGTTSQPKGAMLSHEALMTEYVSCIVEGEYAAGDRMLHALPLYHCAQLHCFLMPSLYIGAWNYIVDSADPETILAAVEDNGLTSVFAPPTVWIGILRHPDFAPERMATVTKGYYGASIMPVEVLKELGEVLPGIRLWNYYGQTEIAPLATVLGPDEQVSKAGSAGRPVLNVETRVVNSEMEDVQAGEMGEIVHRSPQLLTGYYRDPDQTAASFGGGWFHSGDLAEIDSDGYITIVDRIKDMINSGGENVASREVEDVLYKHPAVAEVAVIGLPDERWIEAVCAVVVPKDGSKTDGLRKELIVFARDHLADFKIPKTVRLVSDLPKNPSGKLLKRELRREMSDG